MRNKNAIFAVLLVLVVVSILSFGTDFTGQLIRTGQFQVGNLVPSVAAIYINEELTTDTAGDVIIDPVSNSTKNMTVKVTISDLNGNCDTFTNTNVTVYLCNGTGICNSGTADYTVYLSYNSSDGQWGSSNEYCNMTNNTFPAEFPFYEINGSWKVNATITDGINTSAPVAKNWTYNELASFDYAYDGTIFMGTLVLGQWNNGTGVEEVKSAGNIVLDLHWNATNFSGTTFGQNITIDGTNYIVDDDALSPTDTGNLAQVFMNESASVNVTFVPASGLLTCTSQACSNENSTFDIYWHIDIPPGLAEDTYENTIGLASGHH